MKSCLRINWSHFKTWEALFLLLYVSHSLRIFFFNLGHLLYMLNKNRMKMNGSVCWGFQTSDTTHSQIQSVHNQKTESLDELNPFLAVLDTKVLLRLGVTPMVCWDAKIFYFLLFFPLSKNRKKKLKVLKI